MYICIFICVRVLFSLVYISVRSDLSEYSDRFCIRLILEICGYGVFRFGCNLGMCLVKSTILDLENSEGDGC